MFKAYFRELRNLEVYEKEHGFILYRLEDDVLYIRDMYVSPEYRKQGIATKIANELVDDVKKLGDYRYMIADVEPSNNSSTESVKVLLAYGMRIAEANDDEIVFIKEI